MEFAVEAMTVGIFQASLLEGSAANVLNSVLSHGGLGIKIHLTCRFKGKNCLDANRFMDLSPEGTETFTMFLHGFDGVLRFTDVVFSVLQLQNVNGGGRHTLS